MQDAESQAKTFWKQTRDIAAMLLRDAENPKRVHPLPDGPDLASLEGFWQEVVVPAAIGPPGGNDEKFRWLFGSFYAWRMLSHLVPLTYYHDERVLPMSTVSRMHEPLRANNQIAGYVSHPNSRSALAR